MNRELIDNTTDVLVRRLQKNDLPNVTIAYCTWFSKADVPEQFLRRASFNANPFWWSIAETAAKEISASYAIAGRPINVSGKKLMLGGSPSLIFSDRGARYQRRTSLVFASVAQHCTQTAIEDGLDFCIGVPNDSSLNFHIESFQSKAIGKLLQFSYPLQLSPQIKRLVLHEKIKSLLDSIFMFLMIVYFASIKILFWLPGSKVSKEQELPADYDAFWHEASQHVKISAWKDKEYLEALSSIDRQGHEHETWTIRIYGKLFGIAIIELNNQKATVNEFILLRKSKRLARLFLAQILAQLIRRRNLISIRLAGTPNSAATIACRGILVRKKTSWSVCVRIYSERGRAFQSIINDINAWELGYGDRD